MCLGVAIGGVVVQNRLAVHLDARGLYSGNAREAEAFILVLNGGDGRMGKGEMDLYREAYAETFRNLFEVLLGIAVLAGVLSVGIRHASMNRELDSEHVFAEEGKEKKEEKSHEV